MAAIGKFCGRCHFDCGKATRCSRDAFGCYCNQHVPKLDTSIFAPPKSRAYFHPPKTASPRLKELYGMTVSELRKTPEYANIPRGTIMEVFSTNI